MAPLRGANCHFRKGNDSSFRRETKSQDVSDGVKFDFSLKIIVITTLGLSIDILLSSLQHEAKAMCHFRSAKDSLWGSRSTRDERSE